MMCSTIKPLLYHITDNTHFFYYVGNAGTAMRPLVGVLSAGHGHFVLDGVPRMRERPIIDLVDGLKQVRTCDV